MPANLTPQFYAAEAKYKEATNTRDKLKGLRGMLSAIPKHKGTEKLQGEIKRKIAQIGLEEEQGRKSGSRGASVDHVPHEGAGQVVLVGEPNVGKSTFFSAVTGASAEAAPYPYSTLKPQPGMVRFEDIQVQLVDSPPYSDEFQEAWLPNVARHADALVFVVDLAADNSPGEQFSHLRKSLKDHDINIVPEKAGDDDLPDEEWVKRTIVIGNKTDLAGEIPDCIGEFPVIPVSAGKGEGIASLPPLLFRMLRIVRVYTKLPGKKPDMEKPFVLPIGASVGDFCRLVHKDFARKLRFARLWREGSFQGIQVHQEHDVTDGDIFELHL